MPILGIIASSVQKTPATSFESIASFTPTSGTGVTFSSIPSTYVALQIRYSILTDTAGPLGTFRFNGDTATNYGYHTLQGTGSTAIAGGYTSQTNILISEDQLGASTTRPTVGIIDIHNYASTTQNKTVRIFAGSDQVTTGTVALISGLWRSTSTITSVSVNFIGGGANFASGSTIALYGIKGA